MNDPAPKTALCFFGIPRSLRFTHGSIKRNVVAPLRARTDLKVYAHYFRQDEIASVRSGEFGKLEPDAHRHLDYDKLVWSEPDCADVRTLFDRVKPFGDTWKNDFASLRNLCHQLTSLARVTQEALSEDHDIFVFCRPDLYYHDSLAPAIDQAIGQKENTLLTPYWQAHGGRNDRFAIAVGDAAARAYGFRAEAAERYCRAHRHSLPAEKLVGYATAGSHHVGISQRASRVRFDGTRCHENFDTPRTNRWRKKIERRVGSEQLRVRLLRLLRSAQDVAAGKRYDDLNQDADWTSLTPAPRRPETESRAE